MLFSISLVLIWRPQLHSVPGMQLDQGRISGTSFGRIPGLQLCPPATGLVRKKIPSLLSGISSDQSRVLSAGRNRAQHFSSVKIQMVLFFLFPPPRNTLICTDFSLFTGYARHSNFWYLCTCLDFCHVVLKSIWDASHRTYPSKNPRLTSICSVPLVSRQVWRCECGPGSFRRSFAIVNNDDNGRKWTQKLQ